MVGDFRISSCYRAKVCDIDLYLSSCRTWASMSAKASKESSVVGVPPSSRAPRLQSRKRPRADVKPERLKIVVELAMEVRQLLERLDEWRDHRLGP